MGIWGVLGGGAVVFFSSGFLRFSSVFFWFSFGFLLVFFRFSSGFLPVFLKFQT